MSSNNNSNSDPVVFLDILQGNEPLGRVKIELFKELPRTTENFRQFCTGEYREAGRPTGYKGSKFHRVIPHFMIQGGDFVKFNGTGTKTIYGTDLFDDESFKFDHHKYSVSMANSGPNSNGCQFFICCKRLEHLDGKHVVFGKVVEGFEIVDRIEASGTAKGTPRDEIVISNCGEM
ncbi:cyclophilin type peptidyl-prolyl cis-trans isomerase [Yamadazyma tenuis]|nr:uncharacterized protein CANTEDRAFT_130573 [Yamadazyma tenuis ATCC 10573]EGV63018.1 hypothetical protein CANTEDRAFT_130573 [Yamadazyma tenuis ATCC 10573]WEJ97163.1 cyclophilin type peptidyl-prolyl cis-trans isomerase [Yamadazyma tenuis]